MKKEYIGKYLSIARRAQAKLLDQKLKKYHISHAQLSLLMTLYNQEGICQQELCRILNINKAAVTRELKDLEQKNYISKVRDHNDRRRFLVYLTDKALKNKKGIIAILDKIEEQMRAGISEHRIDEFLDLIKSICTNLNSKTLEEGE
jgi:DNA-binding MarR family transcriptional regulator